MLLKGVKYKKLMSDNSTPTTGLTFLKPRVVSWRYQRGSRSLAINVHGSRMGQSHQDGEEMKEAEEDDEEVGEDIEEVIDYLLQGLKDQDTVVR